MRTYTQLLSEELDWDNSRTLHAWVHPDTGRSFVGFSDDHLPYAVRNAKKFDLSEKSLANIKELITHDDSLRYRVWTVMFRVFFNEGWVRLNSSYQGSYGNPDAHSFYIHGSRQPVEKMGLFLAKKSPHRVELTNYITFGFEYAMGGPAGILDKSITEPLEIRRYFKSGKLPF